MVSIFVCILFPCLNFFLILVHHISFVARQLKSFMERVEGINKDNQHKYMFEIFSLIVMIEIEIANLEMHFYLDNLFSKFKANLVLVGGTKI